MKSNTYEEERFVKHADRFFSGPEHEYQVAIQTEEYTKDRKEYLESVSKVADEARIKQMIIKDFKEWRKYHVRLC